MPKQHGEGDDGYKGLPDDFLTRRYAVFILMDRLQVVVTKSDPSQRGVNEEGGIDPDIRRSPKHGADKDGDKDEQAAHRGNVLLVKTLREISGAGVIVVLAVFKLAQLGNEPGPDEESNDRGGAGRHERSKREESQDTKRAPDVVKV